MIGSEVIKEYFEWLYDTVCDGRFSEDISYRRLLNHLDEIPFRWELKRDSNRASDGIALRHRFGLTLGYDDLEYYITGSCSVLEMMVALAIRIEEDIMDDPHIGNRTGQWFWGMINNLGLGAVTDDRYDEDSVDSAIEIFLDRRYEHDGQGGLFRVRRCERNMQKVEIWIQMLWYLDTIA